MAVVGIDDSSLQSNLQSIDLESQQPLRAVCFIKWSRGIIAVALPWRQHHTHSLYLSLDFLNLQKSLLLCYYSE